jgi:ubiquinone/menaquinone biosynthesis C-methylase UbiE
MDITREFYDKHWTTEKYLPAITRKQHHLHLIFGEEKIKGKCIVDCGSGSGITSLAFRKLGAAHVIGLDQSQNDVNFATQKAQEYGVSNCSFWVKNLLDEQSLTTDLPFKTFDIVYSFGVLHHTSDPQKAFRNIAKLMKDDGLLCVGLYLKTPLTSFFDILGKLYRKSPPFIQDLWRKCIESFLFCYDTCKGKRPHDVENIQSEVHDWFGVPKRSHHTLEEVALWYEGIGCTSKFIGYTGRFKFSTNFIMIGQKK